ncbi:hypothetical protein DKT77_19320 [Meridianimarinicoccus roseus]|uniref:HTH cro/C1-type domain-containing protein n=1 Tax=Meridianimarinicoccus roseus TaxID=2072018 RepID=A0A2V2LCL1_9RHOB|nr:hypothetical protein DKT77_19320 [Meridianimarinicoccus roseus]
MVDDQSTDRARHALIKYQLALRGLTLADIARRANVGTSAVSIVSIGKSRSVRIEALLAEALGTKADELFPERYTNQQGP